MYRNRFDRNLPEGAAIGWISNTDAFLFGVIVLLIVAAMLSSQLKLRTNEQAQLKQQNLVLHGTTQTLKAEVSGERETVRTLQAALALFRKNKTDFVAEIESLQSHKEQLDKQIRKLAQDKTSMQELIKQYEKHIADLGTQRKRYDQLVGECQTLREECQKLREEKRISDAKLVRARKIYDAHLEQIGDLNAKLAASNLALASQTTLKSELAQANKQKLILQTQVDLQTKRHSDERRVRTELIGLKGTRSKVAILFDASESMKEGGRWDSARQVLETWLEYLDMEDCVLIVFSTEVKTFPENGEWLDLRRSTGVKNRADLAKFLENIEPSGGTNTLAALEKAYAYPGLQSIVLFTDGAPNDGKSVDFNATSAKQVIELCGKKRNIPINAVGLGNYFRPELSGFLLKITEISGGTFVGR